VENQHQLHVQDGLMTDLNFHFSGLPSCTASFFYNVIPFDTFNHG